MIPYTSFFETTVLLCLALPTQFESEYAINAEIINTIVKTEEEHKNVSSALCNIKLLDALGEVERRQRTAREGWALKDLYNPTGAWCFPSEHTQPVPVDCQFNSTFP